MSSIAASNAQIMKGPLRFQYIPDFAAFLLRDHFEELIRESLSIAHSIEYPLLKYFAHMPEEQLLELSRVTQSEFLQHVIHNTLDEHIEKSLRQWRENMLPLISKDQIVGDDISMGSYLRKSVWQRFIPAYTQDMALALNIMKELDEFHMKNDAAAIMTFVSIQNENLQHTHDALRESDTLYKQAQAITHIGNWSWTVSTGKVNWSDEMYRIYGLEPQSEEITFERFAGMIHPEDRDQRMAQVYESLETLDPPHYVMRIVRPDGTIIVLSGKNEIEVGPDGKPLRMVGTCQDITTEYSLQESIREANRTLEIKNKELERNNKELSSFNYVASHDLQEPLRKIKTYSDLIARSEENLSDKSKKYFGNINASAQRMNQLIQDLLSYSRTHNYTVDIKPVDLNATLREIRAQFEEQIAATHLTLEVSDLPVVDGISFQFYQLFENLVGNSIKYRKEHIDPIIKISAQKLSGAGLDIAEADKDRDYHVIRILDNGIGFEPEFSSKVFEIFQRLHNADEYSGTGIGLAICKRIVQNHEGYIVASGDPGVGSTFTVYLPA